MFRLAKTRNPLISFSRRNIETGVYQSHHEEVIFTQPLSKSHPSYNVTPSFIPKALVLKNASGNNNVESWNQAFNSDLVRANFTERWGLKQLSSIQKAILNNMRAKKSASLASDNALLSELATLDDKQLHVKLMLDPQNSKLKQVLKLREDGLDLPQLEAGENKELILRELNTLVSSDKDFYIQSSDLSGKLTAVLSIIADELLTNQPDLSPQVCEAPEVGDYKIFLDKEKCHPSAIIVTYNEEESMHAYRIAQRAFARSNASVQWAKYDNYATDFLHKAFTLGANVLVLDYLTFHKAVNRGWVSSTDLKYIVVDDVHKISNKKNATKAFFETLFIQSSWLGQATKRIALSSNDAYHTTHLAKTILRDDYASLIVDEVDFEKPVIHALDVESPRSALSSVPANSIVVVEDDAAAEELLSLFKKAGIPDVVCANESNVNALAFDLSHGRYNHVIVPNDYAKGVIDMFANPVQFVFYNTANADTFARLNRLNQHPEKIHVILGENITPKGMNHILSYIKLVGVELEDRFESIVHNIFNSHNFVKNLKVLNYIDAKRILLQVRNPGKDVDVSDISEAVFNSFEKVLYLRASENERAERIEKLHNQYSGEINKLFRKTPEFREFFNLQILNNVDKEQYKYLKKVVFQKQKYTVGDILEALQSFGVEWKSPAVTLHNQLQTLSKALETYPASTTLAALHTFNQAGGLETPKNAILQFQGLLSIYYDIVTEKRIENFFSVLESEKVKKALASMPSTENLVEFARWYNELDEATRDSLHALDNVLVATKNGVQIPSAAPHKNQQSEAIERELAEFTSSQEYLDEWVSAHVLAMEEASKKLPFDDVETFDSKEGAIFRKQVEALIEKEVSKSPYLLRERELENALVESLYAEHQLANPFEL